MYVVTSNSALHGCSCNAPEFYVLVEYELVKYSKHKRRVQTKGCSHKGLCSNIKVGNTMLKVTQIIQSFIHS